MCIIYVDSDRRLLIIVYYNVLFFFAHTYSFYRLAIKFCFHRCTMLSELKLVYMFYNIICIYGFLYVLLLYLIYIYIYIVYTILVYMGYTIYSNSCTYVWRCECVLCDCVCYITMTLVREYNTLAYSCITYLIK